MKKNKFSKVKKVNLPILNTPIIKNKGSTMNSLPKKDRTLVAKRTFKSKKVSSPSKKTTIKLKVNLLPNNPSKEKLIQQDVALLRNLWG